MSRPTLITAVFGVLYAIALGLTIAMCFGFAGGAR